MLVEWSLLVVGQFELKSLFAEGVGGVEGVDIFRVGDDQIVEEVVLVLGPAAGSPPLVELLGELDAVLLDEEGLAGDVVLADVLDGRRLPLLAEGRLVDLALDLVVVLRVALVEGGAPHEVVLRDGVGGGELLGHGLEVHRPVREGGGVAVDVVRDFKLRAYLNGPQQFLVAAVEAVHVDAHLPRLYDVHPLAPGVSQSLVR